MTTELPQDPFGVAVQWDGEVGVVAVLDAQRHPSGHVKLGEQSVSVLQEFVELGARCAGRRPDRGGSVQREPA
jgi:hypothetical protein